MPIGQAPQSVNFWGAMNPDVSQQQAALQQQQMLAQQMMAEGAQPINPLRSSGRFIVPISGMEAAGHSGKMIASAMMQRSINDQQSKLANQQMQSLIGLLRGGQQAPQQVASAQGATDSPQGLSDQSAQSVGAPWAAASQLPQQPQQQASINPSPGAMGQRSPLSLTGDANKDIGLMMAGQLFGPSYGAALMKQAEPTDFSKLLGEAAQYPQGSPMREQLEKRIAHETHVPLDIVRQNSIALDQQGNVTAFNPPPIQGAFPTFNRGMPTGYQLAPGASAAIEQETAAKKRGEQPFGMQTMKVPVYLPGGDQTEVNLNPMQAEAYNRTGQLPPEIAASIPGYQVPGQQPPSPQGGIPLPQAPQGAPQGPPVNPQQPVVPRTNMSNPPMSVVPPEERPAFNAAIPQKNFVQSGARPVAGRTQSQSEQITQARQTAAGKATDEAFAKDYVSFSTGGAQDSAKQLGQLGDVLKALQDPQASLTGPVLGALPDRVKSITNPNAIAMRERVEEVVQRSLRAVLGAQFTENEGERLIARAYNPSLPEKENAVRVQRLYTQLQQAYEAKQSAVKYFEQNGTLQGWGGKLPSISDFDLDTTKGNLKGQAPTAMFAKNPQTGERITSNDGGKTWQPAR